MTISDLSIGCLREFAYFMTGKEIGRGMSRHVFEYPMDNTKVIKIENFANNFQNHKEWMIWNEFQYCKDISKWLAPCVAISSCGTFLMMEKAVDIRETEIPIMLPRFLSDHKVENFGMIDGKIVCRDYGTAVINLNPKLRKWSGK